MSSETLLWKDFRVKYVNGIYPANFNSRSEYYKYFKDTYPLEYRKYRDHVNEKRKIQVKNFTPEQKEKYKLRCKKSAAMNYIRHKEQYKEYYKKYVRDPINREKNRIRSSKWYYKHKGPAVYNKKPREPREPRTLKQAKPIVKQKKSKRITYEQSEELKKKPAINIQQFSSPITIDFSI